MFYSFDYMFFYVLILMLFLSDHIIIFNALLLEGELEILSNPIAFYVSFSVYL